MATRERNTSESVRQELVRAQTRAEILPRLELELADMNAKLFEVEVALAAARQSEVVAMARLEAAQTRMEEAIKREDQHDVFRT